VEETFSTREKEAAEMSGLNWEEAAQISGREEATRRDLKLASTPDVPEKPDEEELNV
ncbi:TPA: phage portal protein, partial [Salmonella enterica]|nr:phage portal protein [Salmonella enterica]